LSADWRWKHWITPNLTESRNLGAPVYRPPCRRLSSNLACLQCIVSCHISSRLVHNLALGSKKIDAKTAIFMKFRTLWGFDTHPPLRRSCLNLTCKTWPLSCSFMPNFSSIGSLFCGCWLTVGQSNETEKFDWIWPWNFTTNVNCGVGNHVFLALWTMAIVIAWLTALNNKKLSYRWGTARYVASIEILQLLRNSAETTYSTTSPEQIEVMKLEG